MGPGIVTRNFEELKDTMVNQNHMEIVERKIKESLIQKGKRYDGIELDGMLYLGAERMIMMTYKGPMLMKAMESQPTMEVRYELKKTEGDGKGSLYGTRKVKMNWFKNGGNLVVRPGGSRGGQEEVGWCETGIDGVKSGSIYTSLIEWLPQVKLGEIDPFTMGGILDTLSGKEDYTMLFIKAILTFRNISLGYSVEDSEMYCVDDLPKVILGDKRTKIGQLGNANCVIDLDMFNERESLVLLLSSMEYPSVECRIGETKSVYSRMSIEECDVIFVQERNTEIVKEIPSPEKWWKAVVGVACKLGAIDDLVKAFRVSRGWASWLDGMDFLGSKSYQFVIDNPSTRGGKTVLADSNLGLEDRVIEASNLCCGMGELICDWAVGLEMRNMLFHVCDEFGLANVEMNRNASGLEESSVGDSLLREAGMIDYGKGNVFFEAMRERFDTMIGMLGNKCLKRVISDLSKKMVNSMKVKRDRDELREMKNLAFSAYFGKMWHENSSKYIGEDGVINDRSWGSMAVNRSNTVKLRGWMDVYGLSDQVLIMNGYNTLQKKGLENMSQGCIDKIKGANGAYHEIYREVYGLSEYDSRIGNETIEKDRLDFIKTFIGMESVDGFDEEFDKVEKETISTKERDIEKEFIGSMKVVEEEEEDVTEIVKPRLKKDGMSVNRRVLRGELSGTGTMFTFKGVGGFLREVQAPGGDIKIKNVEGDGYCVAKAISRGMQEIGINVNDKQMVEFIQRETGDKDWFEVEPVAILMEKLGVGVTILDTRNKKIIGLGTQNRKANQVIGITFDGSHCDYLTRGTADRLIEKDGDVIEKSSLEVRGMMKAVFGDDKVKRDDKKVSERKETLRQESKKDEERARMRKDDESEKKEKKERRSERRVSEREESSGEDSEGESENRLRRKEKKEVSAERVSERKKERRDDEAKIKWKI